MNFVAFSRWRPGRRLRPGLRAFILTVAAVESAIGLAILVVLFRNCSTITVGEIDLPEGLESHELKPTTLLVIALAPQVRRHRRRDKTATVIGHTVGAHMDVIIGVAVSCLPSFYVLYEMVRNGAPSHNHDIYTWLQVGGLDMHGILIDRLTAVMMVVVLSVSLMVMRLHDRLFVLTTTVISVSSTVSRCSRFQC